MSFEWVRTESRTWLAQAGTDVVNPADANRAVAELRTDYERWSRLWIGVGSYLLSMIGIFLAFSFLGFMLDYESRISLVDAIFLVVLIGLAWIGTVLLLRLRQSGRVLTSAIAWWFRLPYIRGSQKASWDGWTAARTLNFEPQIFARITTSALALLFAVCGVALFVRGIVEGIDALSCAFGLNGVISACCAIGQTGGVMRIVSGMGEGDLLWVRIRDQFRSTR